MKDLSAQCETCPRAQTRGERIVSEAPRALAAPLCTDFGNGLFSLVHKTALILLAAAGACLAQDGSSNAVNNPRLLDLSLDQLLDVRIERVFGASKYEQKVTQAPSSVSIVTSDEIKKFGYRSLADVMRSTRSFYISNDRQYSYLGSRGFLRPGDYNTRYLFLIDGHRMNDNIYDAGWVGTDGSLEVDLIDRVEIIRGPSSSIYGNNAFLGVINVITKTGHHVDGVEGSAEAGSFDTYKGRFTFGKKFANDIEWLASGSFYTSEGQEKLYYPAFDQRISSDPRARNNGVARNADGEEFHQFYTSVAYHDFTLAGFYNSRTKEIPTASFGTFFGSSPPRTTDDRAFVELRYDHRFNEETEVEGRFSYDAYPYKGRYPYDYGTNNSPVDIVTDTDQAFGDWLTTQLQLKHRVFDRHTVIVGAEYRENLHQDLFNHDAQGAVFVDDSRNGRNFALYAQVEAVLLTNLLLNAGLRYDYYNTFGGTLNPRVGLIYNPWEKTTFKLLYGQAFRAPNDYELYYGAPSIFQSPNPDLQPEKIRTYEVIYEQYLPAHLRFSASSYYYEIENLISSADNSAGFSQFQNLNQVRAAGMEFELEGKYPCGVLARVSYALQRTEDLQTGDELSNSPRHLLKGNLAVPLYRDKVFAGFELQYESRVETLAGRHANDFVIANLTLYSREIAKGLEVSAGVYNLFDTKYSYPGSADHLQDTIPQDGRSFRVKLTYKF